MKHTPLRQFKQMFRNSREWSHRDAEEGCDLGLDIGGEKRLGQEGRGGIGHHTMGMRLSMTAGHEHREIRREPAELAEDRRPVCIRQPIVEDREDDLRCTLRKEPRALRSTSHPDYPTPAADEDV